MSILWQKINTVSERKYSFTKDFQIICKNTDWIQRSTRIWKAVLLKDEYEKYKKMEGLYMNFQ